jgi:hypothetical protein
VTAFGAINCHVECRTAGARKSTDYEIRPASSRRRASTVTDSRVRPGAVHVIVIVYTACGLSTPPRAHKEKYRQHEHRPCYSCYATPTSSSRVVHTTPGRFSGFGEHATSYQERAPLKPSASASTKSDTHATRRTADTRRRSPDAVEEGDAIQEYAARIVATRQNTAETGMRASNIRSADLAALDLAALT